MLSEQTDSLWLGPRRAAVPKEEERTGLAIKIHRLTFQRAPALRVSIHPTTAAAEISGPVLYYF